MIRIIADSQEVVTQASPFDESAGRSDAIFDDDATLDIASQDGTVAHEADAATLDPAQQDG